MVNWALSSSIFIAVFHNIHFTSQTEGEVAKIQVMFGGSDLVSEFSPALPEKGALGPANDLPYGFQTSAGGRSHIAFLQSWDAMFLVLSWFPYPQETWGTGRKMIPLVLTPWRTWKQRSGALCNGRSWIIQSQNFKRLCGSLGNSRRDGISRRSSLNWLFCASELGWEWEMAGGSQPAPASICIFISPSHPPTLVGCASQPPLSPVPAAASAALASELGLSDSALPWEEVGGFPHPATGTWPAWGGSRETKITSWPWLCAQGW